MRDVPIRFIPSWNATGLVAQNLPVNPILPVLKSANQVPHSEAQSPSVVSQNCIYICAPKRQRTAALQDASAPTYAPENAKRLGVRLSSAAFESAREVVVILRQHTSDFHEHIQRRGFLPPFNSANKHRGPSSQSHLRRAGLTCQLVRFYLAATMLRWGSAPAPGVVIGALASHYLGSPNGLAAQ
jgi:hypothetical protein